MTSHVAGALPLFLFCFSAQASAASDPVELAAGMIGRPYVWGAEGPRSFDCSGLTHYVFAKFDVELPRRAIDQSQVGMPAGRRLQRGDLVFFSSDTRRSLVTHVGIYEGGGMMIEASKSYGKVRRSRLSDAYWAERFMFARQIDGQHDARETSVPETAPRRPRSDRRAAAVRVLEQLAGVLLKRPVR